MLCYLRALSHEELMQKSLSICKHIENELINHTEIKTIASFAAMPGEIDLGSLLKKLPGRSWYYPKCGPERSISFYLIRSESDDLEPGTYGIREPKKKSHPLVAIEELDLILVPGLAFTLKGKRLGRGGGYYDRFLSQKGLRAQLWGIALQGQIKDNFPIDAHDHLLDKVITDNMK